METLREQKLAAIYRLGQELILARDESRIIHLVLQAAAKVLAFEHASCLMKDSEGKALILRDTVGSISPHRPSAFPLQGKGIVVHVARSGEPLNVPDVHQDPRYLALDPATRSELCVPMRVEEEVIGVLNAESSQLAAFDEDDLLLFQTLADQAAIAIANVRLLDEIQRRADEAAAVSAVLQVLSTSPDLDRAFAEVVSQVRMLTGADRVSLALATEDGEHFTIAALAPPDDALPAGIVLPIAASAAAADVRQGRPHFTPDLEAEADLPAEQALLRAGFRSRLNVPLFLEGKFQGALNLASRRRNAFHQRHLEVLRPIADALAVALTNRRLLEQTARQRDHLAALRKIDRAISETLDLSRIMEVVAEGIVTHLGFKAALVTFYDAEKDALRPVVTYPQGTLLRRALDLLGLDPWSLSFHFDPEETPGYRNLLEGKPWIETSFAAFVHPIIPRPLADAVQRLYGTHCNISVPIRSQQRLLGTILAATEEETIGEEIQQMLLTVADQAAMAIEKARLYEEVRRHAAILEEEVARRTAQLRAEKEQTEAILQNVADAIVITDLEGNIQYANPAFARLTGYSQEELVGQNTRLLTSGQVPDEVFQEMWSTILRGEVWHGEVINRRKDGSLYDADLTIVPLRDEEGKVVGFIGSQRDISQWKEVDRLKSQFISNVSHELRTPLTNIKLYLGLLRTTSVEEYHPAYLAMLERETTRLERLIEDILDLSRLEARVEYSPEPLMLSALVRDLLARFSSVAAARGLTLHADLPETLPLVRADRQQITQAVSNLITNALNYTPAGGRVTVRAWAEGERVCLSVSDTGIGIPPDEQPRIFERFFRGREARRRGVPGTGLGLSIAQEIIHRHGGRITVESRPGEGSTFTLYLPALVVREETAPVQEPALPSRKLETGGWRLLVVDDDPRLLAGLSEWLVSAGYQVWTARDGQEALERLDEARPHLIVSDVMMPRMDGFAFFEAVRSRPDGVSIPFIFLTARGERKTILKGKEMGAEDYLVKPFDPDELLTVVEARLRRYAEMKAAHEAEVVGLRERILTLLSHEFRTPLTYITAYSDMLAESGTHLSNEEFQQMLQGIRRGSERLRRLVLDFLLLVNLETGTAAETYRMRRRRITTLQKLVAAVVERYAPRAEKAGLKIHLKAASPPPPVVADEEYLQDALGRLLDNAIKFSRQKGSQITLRLEARNGEVGIAVQDEGIGIPPEELSNIFKPFHQVDREKLEQPGVGIGLTIAQRLVALHGGRIEVESTVGEGSTFTIWLPAAPE